MRRRVSKWESVISRQGALRHIAQYCVIFITAKASVPLFGHLPRLNCSPRAVAGFSARGSRGEGFLDERYDQAPATHSASSRPFVCGITMSVNSSSIGPRTPTRSAALRKSLWRTSRNCVKRRRRENRVPFLKPPSGDGFIDSVVEFCSG